MAIFALILILSHFRTYWMRSLRQAEFCGHIVVDIVALTSLLYFTGGATNPFVSYYLVPISIAAITLPPPMTWGITAVSLIAYSCLVFFHYPIEHLAPETLHSSHDQNPMIMYGINLHIFGMWVNFAISAGLITYFVVRMAEALRHQEAELSTQKEEQMQDEQLLAIATQAASAAHELGTPLNTMKLIIDNFKDEPLDESQRKDFATLDQQINRCHTTLQRLIRAASFDGKDERTILVSTYIAELLDTWQLIRPDVHPKLTIDDNSPPIKASFHPAIQQSVHNLLNNAADASPRQIEINISWNHRELNLEIRDFGPGIRAEQVDKLSRITSPTASNKPGGLGIGLFLSHHSLNRYGGRVSLRNAEGGGLSTSIVLPVGPVEDP
jgi:two-component system sensor histidine kinase RegB